MWKRYVISKSTEKYIREFLEGKPRGKGEKIYSKEVDLNEFFSRV